MKKRYFILLIVALILCLAGCGECEHEWTEADCLTAKTCTKCSVTEGDPLGHDFAPAECEIPETCTRCAITQGAALGHSWMEASCMAPETCSICGSTQGEALPHTFGKWQISGEAMHRDCEYCGSVETSEIDREVYFWDHVMGHWDPYLVVLNNQIKWATILGTESVGYCLQVRPDRTVQLLVYETVYEGTGEFARYEDNETGEYYHLTMTLGEEKIGFELFVSEDSYSLVLAFTNGYLIFSQQELVQEYVSDTWAAANNGQVYTLVLNEDGTFDFSGQFQGTWHLRPAITDTYSGSNCDVLLSFSRDGEQVTEHMNVQLGYEDVTMEEYILYYNTHQAYMYWENDYLYMTKMEPEEIAELEVALAEGKEKIIGTWNSLSADKYIHNGESTRWIDTSKSIEFRQDGTFTAYLETEKEGTWTFQNASVNSPDVYYAYELQYANHPEVTQIYCTVENDNYLDLNEIYDGYTMGYEFRNAAVSADEDSTLALTGTWTSTSTDIYYYDSRLSEYMQNYANTLTFHEDGTVEGVMDGEKTGTWLQTKKYTSEYSDGTVYHSYTYLLQFDGEAEAKNVHCGNSGSMSISEVYKDHSENYDFTKHTREEVDGYLQQFIGTWSSVAVVEWNSAAGKYEEKPHTGYQITVLEDGTISISMNQERTGTWTLHDEDPDYGIDYYIHFEGENVTETITIELDGRLSAWESMDSDYIRVMFEKN